MATFYEVPVSASADKSGFALRIVGFGVKPASQFQANPLNWRKHPAHQRKAVYGSLTDLGWVDVVIENKRTGNLIDGHERVWDALSNNDANVPYIQVDLNEAEEAQALLSLDSLASLAETDAVAVNKILQNIQTESRAVAEFLADFASTLPDVSGLANLPPDYQIPPVLGTYVLCPNCGFRFETKENP